MALWELTTPPHPCQLLSGGLTSLWGAKCRGDERIPFAKVLPAVLPAQNYSTFPHPHPSTLTSTFSLTLERDLGDVCLHLAAPGPPHPVPTPSTIVPAGLQISSMLILPLRGPRGIRCRRDLSLAAATNCTHLRAAQTAHPCCQQPCPLPTAQAASAGHASKQEAAVNFRSSGTHCRDTDRLPSPAVLAQNLTRQEFTFES